MSLIYLVVYGNVDRGEIVFVFFCFIYYILRDEEFVLLMIDIFWVKLWVKFVVLSCCYSV